MEFRQLRYFIVTAEEGHITRAAERLGMQQPPLSRQIKAIEDELGVQLFRRKSRGVELTAPGRALLDDARAILSQLDRAVETTRRTARGVLGRICIGATPTSPFHPFVPNVIRAFRESFPMVSVTLEEWPSNELVERLRDGTIDAAFIRTLPADPTGIATSALLQEELVVVLPVGHQLARDKAERHAPLSLKMLANETFLIQGGRAGLSMYADTVAACRAAGFNPRVGQEAPRLASTLSLVAVGLGISIVPASLQRVGMDGVVYRRLMSPMRLSAPLILATRRGDPSAVVRHYVDMVKRASKEFAGLANTRRGQKRPGNH
jgi:DNA-binding transcriptional LysR family regulator